MRLVVTHRAVMHQRHDQANSIEIRKPIVRYMIGSIMKGTPRHMVFTKDNATAGGTKPAHWRVNESVEASVNEHSVFKRSGTGSREKASKQNPQNGFQVARGVYFR